LIFIFNLGRLVVARFAQEPSVIVCHCRAATDREIRRAVREGAATLREVGSRCGAASGCGGCAEAVIEIIAAELGGAPRALDCDPSSTSL
jgi:bacterioferritin-associated ferredoxin